jgi:hypothetical protein
MYPAGSIRDSELAALLASYKRDVAGAYTSVSPDDIASIIPAGRHVASTKIDGEQWFLCRDCECSFLASPNGKVITGVPITEEAAARQVTLPLYPTMREEQVQWVAQAIKETLTQAHT